MNKYAKILVIVLITLLTNCDTSQSQTFPFQKEVLNFTKNAKLKTAFVGFYAIDADNGQVLASYNADKAFKPASVMKVVTTAAALDLLGPDYRFETKIAYSGTIDPETKTLNGNIYIIGGGDPTLGSKHFEVTATKSFLHDWYKAIINAGIQKINGSVIADASLIDYDMAAPAWTFEDLGNYYGAGPSGVTIFDNIVTLYFNTGAPGQVCKLTRIDPPIKGLTFDNQVMAAQIKSDESYIFGTPYHYDRYIRGELPAYKTDYDVDGSMPDPAFYSAYVLDSLLKVVGVEVSGKPTTVRLLKKTGAFNPEQRKILHTTYSPKLSDIISLTNQKSINLFAEHLLIAASLKLQGPTRIPDAAKKITEFWSMRGINTEGLFMADGSGLSHQDMLTPRQIVEILKYMYKSKYNEVFDNSLPLAGVRGTMKRMFKNTAAENNLRAKSGTIRHVKNYAGYVKTASGRNVIFALFTNNFDAKSREIRKLEEKLMVKLAEFDK